MTANALFLAQAAGLFLQLMRNIPEASLRQEYRRRIRRFLRARRDPATLLSFVFSCAMHYHAHSLARQMASGRTAVFSGY